MDKSKLTNEESLKIITSMIHQARVNIRQSSFHLLFWGWLIFFCSSTEFLLYKFTDIGTPYYIWLFVIPGIFVSMIYGFKTGRRERVITYADRIYMWLWLAFMVTTIILFILMIDRMGSFVPFMLMMAGFPTFMSGIILKFKPLIAGGIIFWAISVISSFTGPDIMALSMPVAVVTGYLIPGYMLKHRNGHDNIQ